MIEIDEIISNAEYCADVYERMNKAIHPALQVSDYKRHAEDHRQLAEWLKELKLLREQTRWIPVDERTPEDRRTVLVTAYWHETYQVMMGSYYGDGLWWCVPFNNCGKHMQKLNPKEWMPLPSGYQGD